jgi:hypothetical protein
MSIVNVNRIQPVGSGQTVTINAANISAGSATVTAGTFSGNVTGGTISGVSTAGITTAYINTLSGISTISASGSVSINQNLVFASGKGIDFSATANSSGTMTSELLADYEEGSWSPVMDSESPGTGRSTSIYSASYTKIGTVVYFKCYVQLAVLGSGGSGAFYINGLPFSSRGSSHFFPVSVGFFDSLNGNVNYITGTVQPSSSSIRFRITTAAAATIGDMTFSTYIKQSSQFIVSGCYLV